MMMERKVYIDTIGQETRRVVVEDGRPVELAITYRQQSGIVGNIYLGRVMNVLKGMNAAFVDIGLAKNAFLSMDDLPGAMRDVAQAVQKPAGNTVRAGQEVLVQVVKDAGGSKGPKVTMNITFPGQYAVLLPTVQAVGVSRHIQDTDTRKSLQQLGESALPEGMGVILRTAAETANHEDISAEIGALVDQWQQLSVSVRTQKPPALVWTDGDLEAQARRDLGGEIITGPLPDTMEASLDKLLRRKVWLKSGGYLVIDPCEAMTVIDVNSGKNTGKKTLAETLLALNQEAAVEIARQLRLRDIGGIVIIDFVDMETEEDRDAVLKTFETALQEDRAKHHVHGFTGAGLLELTRRPVFSSLTKETRTDCTCCGGMGTNELPVCTAHALLRHIRRRRNAGDTSEITLHVSSSVAEILHNTPFQDDALIIIAD